MNLIKKLFILETDEEDKNTYYISVYTNKLIDYFKSIGIIVFSEDIQIVNDSIAFQVSSNNYNGNIGYETFEKLSEELQKNTLVSTVHIDNNKYMVEIVFESDKDFIVELY